MTEPTHNASEPPLISLKRARKDAARELLADFAKWLSDQNIEAGILPDIDVERYLKEVDRG